MELAISLALTASFCTATSSVCQRLGTRHPGQDLLQQSCSVICALARAAGIHLRITFRPFSGRLTVSKGPKVMRRRRVM
jgi:hypothetical protein